MTKTSVYSPVDDCIRAWVERNSLKLFTRQADREIRCAYVSSKAGECYQIWIDPPKDGEIVVHAACVEGRRDTEGALQDWGTPISKLDSSLESALRSVIEWMKPSERHLPIEKAHRQAAIRNTAIYAACLILSLAGLLTRESWWARIAMLLPVVWALGGVTYNWWAIRNGFVDLDNPDSDDKSLHSKEEHSAVDKPDIEKEVIELLKPYAGNRAITLETKIIGDLTIDGDDADEFMADFVKKFNVDYTNFPFREYFVSEYGAAWKALRAFGGLYPYPTKKDLTVRDLIEAAKQKVLISK